VIDKRAKEFRPGRPLLDHAGELFVLLLGRSLLR
jgi:hypothetical protein